MATIEAFADVDVSEHAAWLHAIPVSEWPKMADPNWHGWTDRFKPLVWTLMREFPDGSLAGLGLFLLAPGQEHPAHRDEQPPDWLTRVHVPIVTNDKAAATTDDGTMHMQVGKAYKFNTLETHAVSNQGTTPRVHLVFDVRKNERSNQEVAPRSP